MASQENLVRGALYSLFAFLCFAIFGALVKAADNAGWSNFIAFGVACAVFSLFLFKEGVALFKTEHGWLHFFRAFFGVAASLAYVYSIRYTSLLDATLLYNATPLFIPFFVLLLMRVGTGRLSWIAIAIGYVGVAFIIRPDRAILEHPGNLIALGAGALLALAFTFVKMLTVTDSYRKIVFYFLMLATILQFPLIPLFGPLPSLTSVWFSCGAGLALMCAQWGVSKSYSYASASKIGIFQYSGVVFIGLIDWLVWGITPSLYDYIGAVIVMGAGMLIIVQSRHHHAI